MRGGGDLMSSVHTKYEWMGGGGGGGALSNLSFLKMVDRGQ
jgi:hypothetical protein